MKRKEIDNNFIRRKAELLKFFDKLMKNRKKALVSRYGADLADTIMKESRQEYESLIPQMPEMRDDDKTLERQLILCTVYLAIYKVMKRRGKTTEEIWELCDGMIKAYVSAIPRFVRWLARKRIFSKKELARQRKSAAISQKRLYPADFVFTFIEGKGKEFDWGIDFTECAMCKFYRNQNAEDFLPYICLTDKILSEAFGYGFVRTKTLAEGFDRCDFRWKKRGEIKVASKVWKKEWDKT